MPPPSGVGRRPRAHLGRLLLARCTRDARGRGTRCGRRRRARGATRCQRRCTPHSASTAPAQWPRAAPTGLAGAYGPPRTHGLTRKPSSATDGRSSPRPRARVDSPPYVDPAPLGRGLRADPRGLGPVPRGRRARSRAWSARRARGGTRDTARGAYGRPRPLWGRSWSLPGRAAGRARRGGRGSGARSRRGGRRSDRHGDHVRRPRAVVAHLARDHRERDEREDHRTACADRRKAPQDFAGRAAQPHRTLRERPRAGALGRSTGASGSGRSSTGSDSAAGRTCSATAVGEGSRPVTEAPPTCHV